MKKAVFILFLICPLFGFSQAGVQLFPDCEVDSFDGMKILQI